MCAIVEASHEHFEKKWKTKKNWKTTNLWIQQTRRIIAGEFFFLECSRGPLSRNSVCGDWYEHFFFFFYNPSTKKSILPSAFDRSCVENKNKTKTSMPVLMTVLFCFFVYLFYFAKARGQSRWYCEKSYQPVVSLNCLSDGVEVCTFYKNKFFARIFTHVIHCRTTLRSRWYLSVCFWESSKCKKFNSYRRDVTRVYEWGSKFKTTKCRTADISKIRNFEYWNNKSSYWI